MASIRLDPTWQQPLLLERAWQLPVAKLFKPLLSQTVMSICGPTSVANVLRSMGVPSGRNPLRGFGLRPMSLDQIVDESSGVVPAGWRVASIRPRSVAQLRDELQRANDVRFRFIANFTRGPLFGRGGGHHSPIGGYLVDDDLVFVLDVNRGFGPWLVRPERLFDAMSGSADGATGATRGLARFQNEV